jgi:hypothetical protein
MLTHYSPAMTHYVLELTDARCVISRAASRKFRNLPERLGLDAACNRKRGCTIRLLNSTQCHQFSYYNGKLLSYSAGLNLLAVLSTRHNEHLAQHGTNSSETAVLPWPGINANQLFGLRMYLKLIVQRPFICIQLINAENLYFW